MKLASDFEVPAAPDKVAALFFDAATMRDCIPGCEELEQVDDKTYRGVLTDEIAHVRFKARFSAEITSVENGADASGGSVVRMVLKGEDRRLGSTIKADARMSIVPLGQHSRVAYELEMAMWGKLGRLGESVIRRRSVEAERQFSKALTAVCAGKPITQKQAKSPGQAQRATQPLGAQSVVAGDAADQVVAMPVRKESLPFVIAVSAAAFAFGIILGSRKRGR